MIRIGILGDIGSGKSYIAKKFGYPVFDADEEVSKLYKKDKKIFINLNKKLPNHVHCFPIDKNEISDAILRLNIERNFTFFVIEHDMDLIEKFCDPVIVMAEGSVLFEGKFAEVKSNEEVIEAYLGRGLKSKK